MPTRTMRSISVSHAGRHRIEDLRTLGLRVEAGQRRKRGGHDMRSWYGAHRDLLRVCSHGSGTDVLDGYTRTSWPARCAEAGKLKVAITTNEVLELATDFATAEKKASNR